MAKQKISFKRNKNIEPPKPKRKASIYEEVNGEDEDYIEDLDNDLLYDENDKTEETENTTETEDE